MKQLLKCLNGCMLVCLLVIACKKDNPAVKEIGCQLSSLGFGSFTLQMNYNADGGIARVGLLNKDTALEYYTYTYTPGKVMELGYSAKGQLFSTGTYTLGSNGYASLGVLVYEDGMDSTYYTYNSDGYLTSARKVSYSNNNGTYVWSATLASTYTIENGNKVKETNTNKGTDVNYTSALTYEYYADKPGYDGLYSEYTFLGKHNASLLKKTTNVYNGTESSTAYSYEFDTEGRPTKSIQKQTSASGTSTSTWLLQFACK